MLKTVKNILPSLVVLLPIANTTDLTLNGISDQDLDKVIELDLNKCDDLHMDSNAMHEYHQNLKNKLSLLQEYIPFTVNYSKTFDNPCWYDFHQKPTSPLIKVPNCCGIAMSYEKELTKTILKQVKKSGKRHLYCLPAFYLIGFPKCATTTLYKMMIKHPLIADTHCQIKENHFWSMFVQTQGTDLDKKMQILHHLNYFSQSVKTVESNPKCKILDGSVSYLIWTSWTTTPYTSDSEFCLLPSLFMRVLPEAKFIVIMRNPTERTFSHYYHYSVVRANGITNFRNVDGTEVYESFHTHSLEAIMNFQSCVDSEYSVSYCVRQKGIDGEATSLDGYVGIQTSLYYYHIVPWLSVIPRERFLFLRTEDLAYAPQSTMTELWNFLDLYNLPDYIRTFENVNRQADGLILLPQTKELLDDFFQPYNQLLAHLLSDNKYLWND